MFMAQEASKNHLPSQLKPLPGAAQRRGAKSGAKRSILDPTSTPEHEIKTTNQFSSLYDPHSPSPFSH
jgi:hypothetical protein